MAHDEFLTWPEDIQQLIDDIGTVEGLDVMCTMARDPSTPRRMEQLADELAVDRYALDDAVRRLIARSLIERLPDGRLQLGGSSPARRASLAVLGRLCEQDRANVLGAIAHFSISRIRSSAVRTFVRKANGDRSP